MSKIGLKNLQKLNCLLKLKFDIKTNASMLNLMVMFTFAALNWKYCLWEIWSEKSKFRLLCNLVFGKILVFWSSWCCSLFLFQNENTRNINRPSHCLVFSRLLLLWISAYAGVKWREYWCNFVCIIKFCCHL